MLSITGMMPVRLMAKTISTMMIIILLFKKASGTREVDEKNMQTAINIFLCFVCEKKLAHLPVTANFARGKIARKMPMSVPE